MTELTRPRWRGDQPLLWRKDGGVQLGLPWTPGLGPPPAIGVGIDRAGAAWLESLDGAEPLAAAAGRSGLGEVEVARLLRFAACGGAVDDAAQILDAARWLRPEERLRLRAQADAARIAGQGGVAARSRRTVRVEGWAPVAEPVRERLQRAGIPLVDGAADLVVGADCGHPEVIRDPLAWQGQAHLPVLAFGPWAGAGPLAVPGVTSCRMCRHLHRNDADPDWGMLALQWSASTGQLPDPPIDELLVDLVAAHAALLVRAWTERPEDPRSWGNTAVLASLHDGFVERVPRPVHPMCGCRWDPRLGAEEGSG